MGICAIELRQVFSNPYSQIDTLGLYIGFKFNLYDMYT